MTIRGGECLYLVISIMAVSALALLLQRHEKQEEGTMSNPSGAGAGAGNLGYDGLGRDARPELAPVADTWHDAEAALRQRASDLKRVGRDGDGRAMVKAADYLRFMETARRCPQDDRHTIEAHMPGGAWYGHGHGGQASPWPLPPVEGEAS